MGLLQHAYRPAMGSVLVGQQDELAPQSLAQQGQELNHLLKRDIPVMDAKAQPEVLPLLGRRDPRDHRQPVVLIPRSAWAADPDAAWLAGRPPLLPPVRNRIISNPYQASNLTNPSAAVLQKLDADQPADLQCFCDAFCPHGPEHIYTSSLSQHEGQSGPLRRI
jgi:hypothetical protein